MSDNPYQSPRSDLSQPGAGRESREDLKSIATFQKGILVCILLYLMAVIGQFALPVEARLFLGLGVLAVGVVATVFVFLLALKIYSTAVGVTLGILTLIPCVGLIVLLIVNGKATGILKANGIKVGLIGAKLSEI